MNPDISRRQYQANYSGRQTYLGLSQAVIHNVQEAMRTHGVVHLRRKLCATLWCVGLRDVYDG